MKKIFFQTGSQGNENNNIFKKDLNLASAKWIDLKNKLNAIGYDFVTADNNGLKDCERIIFLDALSLFKNLTFRQKAKNAARKLFGIKIFPPYPTRDLYGEALKAGMRDKMYIILWEAGAVCADNFLQSTFDKFDHILTWNDDLVAKDKKFIRFYQAMEPWEVVKNPIPFKEKKLLVNISFNKYSNYKNELYSARKKTSIYFNDNYPNDFDLYGPRWNKPVTRLQLMFPKILVKNFKTYRGITDNKIMTMSRYKFCVSYDNISDAKGYMADRIFCAFQSKSVPIYWGAPDINKYVDRDTFIDRREFKSEAEMAKFLISMEEDEYNKYLSAADRYMQSEKYYLYSNENFSNTIINALKLKN